MIASATVAQAIGTFRKKIARHENASTSQPPATVPVLAEHVTELLTVGFEQLIIDLRGLSFIDVSGLRLLLSLGERARSDGWRLSLIQGSEPVRRLFTLTDTDRQLPFSPPASVQRP